MRSDDCEMRHDRFLSDGIGNANTVSWEAPVEEMAELSSATGQLLLDMFKMITVL